LVVRFGQPVLPPTTSADSRDFPTINQTISETDTLPIPAGRLPYPQLEEPLCRSSVTMSDRQFDADDYTVGWVCALPLEMAAARGMVDEVHPNLVAQASGDHNNYVLGQVAGHNVVVACRPAGIYGTTPAATVAKDMLRTFKSIRFGLMVGIGGGAPSSCHDIRLGDVVVSQPSGTTGGVIQYDRGKDRPEAFERTGSLNAPPQLLLTALGRLQADHLMEGSRIPGFLSELLGRYPKMKKTFSSQGESNDCLFQADYEHPDGNFGCHKCDHTKVVQRDARDDAEPVVHYGNIASGNLVIEDSNTRDRLSKELGVLCFEMEAAGLMQDFPFLVILGICDYADSHKNKAWHGYAAAVAAAFAKELLSVISPGHVLQHQAIPQVVSGELQ
jgi:nucleoside phosphorylase